MTHVTRIRVLDDEVNIFIDATTYPSEVTMLPPVACRAELRPAGSLSRSLQIACFIGAACFAAPARAAPLHETLDLESKAIEAGMIDWRRDIHQNPELGNRRCERRASSPNI
jgi:hypothetical protein